MTLITNKQSTNIEIRPYVTLEMLVKIIEKHASELANAIKDLAAAKVALRDAEQQHQQQIAKQKQYDAIKATIIVATGIVTAATAAAAVMWWNPGGWASVALIAEKTAEIAALTATLTAISSAIAATLTAGQT